MPIPQLHKKSSHAWREYKNVQSMRINSLKKNKKFLKKIKLTALFIIAALFVFSAIYVFFVSRTLPNPNELINREIAQSTKIYDRSGEKILYEISGDQKRTLVNLKDIPDYVKQATVSIEDKNFYKHGAFSVWAMFRTVITNVIFNRSAGGSTLTQQFVKNAVLTPEKTISRKIKELILSYRLEKKFSKDEILQMYLNEIPYGSNAYGVEAASQKYFGKHVKDVSLAEAAILAAIVQTPSRYSPYGPNKDILLSRKDYVLELMAEQGYISETERDAAQKQEIKFNGPETNITAPHFVMYIKNLLADRYGEKIIEQGGLKIYTTLDINKQKIAEEVITSRTKDYPKKYGANNAALVAIDPKNGQILAMVGSRDYFDDSIDGQVNIATRPRQPGSSMKPIVYAALFGLGYTPDTILYDVLTNFSTDPSQPYQPRNYNGQESGPVSIRKALAGSLNIPAVKAIYLAGVNNVIDLAENLGYSTLYPRDRFGLALVLGGAEVKLLEHVNAYSAFARDGQVSQITGILKVEDKDGKVLEEAKTNTKKALDSKVARMINSILTDNNARAFIFTINNYLNLGDRPVGAKTGTTNDYHDAWTIGYTPSLVAGVWVGNSDNQAMKGKADGSVVAAPIWHDFMAKSLNNTPIETFKLPDDYKTGKAIIDGQIPSETIKIDISTGLLANEFTPLELISEKTAPSYHSILYFIDKNNPLGPAPTDPSQDPQFKAWEEAVLQWAAKNASSTSSTTPGVTSGENKPIVVIESPLRNQVINNFNLDIQTRATGLKKIIRTEFYLNNNLWETVSGADVSFSKNIDFLSNGYHSLTARACDESEICGESRVDFNILINNNPNSEKNYLEISSPQDNSSYKNSDFPININLKINKAKTVSKINILVKDLSSGNIITIKTLGTPNSASFNTAWDSPPPAGNYLLYAQLEDWNEGSIKSNELRIKINK